MYHDRYSRRRAVDSFHEDEENAAESEGGEKWSWALFIGVLLVQVTSRSVWASFGVISIFIFGDQGPSWVLLATPIAFSTAWGLTEPWVKRLCNSLTSSTEFMYVIVAGTVIAWFGTIIAVKSPMNLSHLLPLLGVIGGCGANIMASASTSLVRKHFPARSGAIRFFEQTTASLAFFLMPVLSCFTMESFGEHGGLLIHGAILMQGFVGCSLLRGTQWKEGELSGRRPRSYAFTHEDEDLFLPSIDRYQDESQQWDESVYDSETSSELIPSPSIKTRREGSANEKNSVKVKRIAFGLGATPDTPPERRKSRSTYHGLLPSIQETVEEEEEEDDGEENFQRKDFTKEIRISIEQTPPASPVNVLPKPPRTFKHRFSPDRIVPTHGEILSEQELNFYWDNICDTSNAQQQLTIESSDKSLPPKTVAKNEPPITKRPSPSAMLSALSMLWRVPWWKISVDLDELWETLAQPLTIPAAFLLYTTQSCLLGFLTLTPALLDAFIDDGTKLDGAYCVSVMGFTWLCFVIASPCFSTIHFSNHQTICIVALLSSSLNLYMVSQSSSLDEMVLYSSLFGLSYGVARMTSYSILKMSFDSKTLNDLAVPFSIVASVFQLFFLLIVVLWEWTHHLKNLYKFQVVALVCSALFWTVQGCISSVRAKRGRHEFTWSRRRRVS